MSVGYNGVLVAARSILWIARLKFDSSLGIGSMCSTHAMCFSGVASWCLFRSPFSHSSISSKFLKPSGAPN